MPLIITEIGIFQNAGAMRCESALSTGDYLHLERIPMLNNLAGAGSKFLPVLKVCKCMSNVIKAYSVRIECSHCISN